jgi:hypothetical protein
VICGSPEPLVAADAGFGGCGTDLELSTAYARASRLGR